MQSLVLYGPLCALPFPIVLCHSVPAPLHVAIQRFAQYVISSQGYTASTSAGHRACTCSTGRPSWHDDLRVCYFSIAGRMGALNIWHPLRFPKVMLDSAADATDAAGNDGLVSVDSARWASSSAPSRVLTTGPYVARAASSSTSTCPTRGALPSTGATGGTTTTTARKTRRSSHRGIGCWRWWIGSWNRCLSGCGGRFCSLVLLLLMVLVGQQGHPRTLTAACSDNAKPRGDLESMRDLEQLYAALARKLYHKRKRCMIHSWRLASRSRSC